MRAATCQADHKTLRDFNPTQITYTDDVEWLAIDKTRKAQRKQEAGHADGTFDKALAFNGWQKNLYSHAWFDSTPEFQAAGLIDSSSSVVVWARLHNNDVPIQWTTDGRNYNPDFVVIEEIDGKRFGWLVETKSDKDMPTAEVQAKRRAAKKWPIQPTPPRRSKGPRGSTSSPVSRTSRTRLGYGGAEGVLRLTAVHHPPQLSSCPPSTHGSSALPGAMVDGMEAHNPGHPWACSRQCRPPSRFRPIPGRC